VQQISEGLVGQLLGGRGSRQDLNRL
jgi:hypothetical protein